MERKRVHYKRKKNKLIVQTRQRGTAIKITDSFRSWQFPQSIDIATMVENPYLTDGRPTLATDMKLCDQILLVTFE